MKNWQDSKPITSNLKGTLLDLESRQQWQNLGTNISQQKGLEMTKHYLYLILFKLNMKKIDKVLKILNKMDQRWVVEQKVLKLKQIKEKIEKRKKRDQYMQKRLILCKSWGGPVVTILKSDPDKN